MTPEARAEERYPCESSPEFDGEISYGKSWREAAATIIREQVEPLEVKVQEQADEVAKLRSLVQMLLYHGEALSALIEVSTHFKQGASKHHWEAHVKSWEYARNKAKEHGFVPTNTEEK
jgi:hypothetical protein